MTSPFLASHAGRSSNAAGTATMRYVVTGCLSASRTLPARAGPRRVLPAAMLGMA